MLPVTNPSRSRCWLRVAPLLGAGLLAAHDAHANMAKWWSEGASHGSLVPQSDTEVRVDSEDLSFVVAPTLASAEVTATYRMTNGGRADAQSDVAFVMVSAEHGRPEVEAKVTIDGASVTGRLVTEADMLGPLLERWLGANPEAAHELEALHALDRHPRYRDTEKLRRFAKGCDGDCSDLLRWYASRPAPRRDDVLRASAEAIPEEIPKLQRGWTTRSYHAPLSWLTFPLAIPAGASRTVVVRYTHVAGSDSRRAVNTVFNYEYLLSPAKRWARFGELHVDLQLPPDTKLLSSSVPFAPEPNGSSYRASLPGLPAGELSVELMSRRGLLFGMEQTEGYWLILIAVMALVTIPASAKLGRIWAKRPSRAGRILGCVFGTGAAALVWNGVIEWALSQAFPQRAFGFSYDVAFGLLALLVLSSVVAIVIGLFASKATKAASPSPETAA